MGVLDYILGCWNMLISREKVQAFDYNLKKGETKNW